MLQFWTYATYLPSITPLTGIVFDESVLDVDVVHGDVHGDFGSIGLRFKLNVCGRVYGNHGAILSLYATPLFEGGT